MHALQVVLDHLWQSTLFVGIVALAAFALRGRSAGVRSALWFVASLKFLVPLAALSAVGAAVGARLPMNVPGTAAATFVGALDAPLVAAASTAITVTEAAGSSASGTWLTALLVTWSVGTALALITFAVRWGQAIRLTRAATPLDTGREVALLRSLEAALGHTWPLRIRLARGSTEPAVFGVMFPVLLWPAAMSDRLSDEQIETILIHELAHVRRRDNLMAMVQAMVQAVWWFHPLVWWVGGRLIDERERACDEQVVRLGRDRQTYAESLLRTCQFCLEAPVACLSGVTGANLKRRVARIMSAPIGADAGTMLRASLALAVVVLLAAPIVGGAAGVPQATGTGLSLPDPSKTFDAASVRQNRSDERSSGSQMRDGSVAVRNGTFEMLIQQAFQVPPTRIIGGPNWMTSDRFDLVGKADASTADADLRVMLQNMLIERFAMKLQVETRNLPIYELRLARADGRLGPNLVEAECETHSSGPDPCSSGAPRAVPAGGGGGGGRGGAVGTMRAGGGQGVSGIMSGGLVMPGFAQMLSRLVGRNVVDRTGLTGRYEVDLKFANPSVVEAGGPADAPEIFTAIQEQLGLKLEATRGPVEVLVIESASHPVNDDFEMPESVRAIPPPPPGAPMP